MQKSRLGEVKPGEAPSGRALLGAVGGIRGLIEAILPGLGFLVLYTITHELWISVLAPFAIAVVFIAVRAIQRQPVMPAITGAVGIALSAGLALLTGSAANNFLLGFVINGVAVVALVISLLVRRPLVGVIVGLLTGDEHWRHDAAKLKVAYVATVLWLLLSGPAPRRAGAAVPRRPSRRARGDEAADGRSALSRAALGHLDAGAHRLAARRRRRRTSRRARILTLTGCKIS